MAVLYHKIPLVEFALITWMQVETNKEKHISKKKSLKEIQQKSNARKVPKKGEFGLLWIILR